MSFLCDVANVIYIVLIHARVDLTKKHDNYLRNKFNFWSVHGIMNPSGLVQSKLSLKGFTLTLQDRTDQQLIYYLSSFNF